MCMCVCAYRTLFIIESFKTKTQPENAFVVNISVRLKWCAWKGRFNIHRP